MPEAVPLQIRQLLALEVRRRAAVGLLQCQALSPADRLRTLAAVQARCPIPER
jgi:hypothetical protein